MPPTRPMPVSPSWYTSTSSSSSQTATFVSCGDEEMNSSLAMETPPRENREDSIPSGPVTGPGGLADGLRPPALSSRGQKRLNAVPDLGDQLSNCSRWGTGAASRQLRAPAE